MFDLLYKCDIREFVDGDKLVELIQNDDKFTFGDTRFALVEFDDLKEHYVHHVPAWFMDAGAKIDAALAELDKDQRPTIYFNIG